MSFEKEQKKCEVHTHPRKIETLVEFRVSGKPFYLPQGYYLVKDIKRLSGVPECHVLAEIRNGEVDVMTDDTATHLCGGEEFKSFPGKGDAS